MPSAVLFTGGGHKDNDFHVLQRAEIEDSRFLLVRGLLMGSINPSADANGGGMRVALVQHHETAVRGR